MANFEFKLPDIGEGVVEGEVVSWHVQEGDRVAQDQVMVEVMTDKATVTIGAPRAGKVVSLCAEVGATVQVGEVLVVLATGNGSRATGGKPSKMPASGPVGDIQETLPGASYFAQLRASEQPNGGVEPAQSGASRTRAGTAPVAHGAASAGALQGVPSYYADKPLATPATRKFARDQGVDLRQVPPTGPGGRVTRDDLLAFVNASKQAGLDAQPTLAPPPMPQSQAPSRPEDERVPFVGLRRKIAERMTVSKNTAAHFTFVEECDATRLMELRTRLRESGVERGVELTFLPFIVKAVVTALKHHPKLNASLDHTKNEVVMHRACHIGIAAATDQGLLVPVLKHADKKTLVELAAEIERLGRAARTGDLTVAELSGSTFTITSLGKQAGLFAVPIINLPNVGIMGVHRIKERPVVRDGKVVVGNVMLLSLSLDHRIVDGHEGAAFAYDVIGYLEDPARMLLDL